MDVNDSFMSCSTQFSEAEEGNPLVQKIKTLLFRLEEARVFLPLHYECLIRYRDQHIRSKEKYNKDVFSCKKLKKDFFLIDLGAFYSYFDRLQELKTPLYRHYVLICKEDSRYVDYATELRRIRNEIFESEITWYINHLPKNGQFVQQGLRPFITLVAKQDPREARHTHTVLEYAVVQLEKITEEVRVVELHLQQRTKTWDAFADNILVPKEIFVEVETFALCRLLQDTKEKRIRYQQCAQHLMPLFSEQEAEPYHQHLQQAKQKLQAIEQDMQVEQIKQMLQPVLSNPSQC